MPIFEFRCTSCNHQFEVLVRGSEREPCPECGTDRLEKLLSAPAGHVPNAAGLPIAPGCPPPDAPPCGPGCCRIG